MRTDRHARPAKWEAVKQIAAGQEVRVQLRIKQKVSGFLVTATDTELQLEKEGVLTVLKQTEIKKVWRVTGVDRAKQRLFRGLGVGAGLLAGILIAVPLGFQQCGGSCNEEKVGVAGALIGLPIAGGVVGHKLAGSGKRVLVYTAP
ncbi:MAG: hypothetical protein HYR56_24075 [Acidobacteria bacterium]|nr:hypothetical protein [Acidobacteriota bacterium]MBI3427965.1 hypothetical protein [Acidobacteriota bacterium]